THSAPGIVAHATLQTRMDPTVLRTYQRASASARAAPELVLNGGVDLGHGHGFHGRDIDVLPVSYSIAHVQCQHRRRECANTGSIQRRIPTDLERFLVGQANCVHQRPEGLDHEFRALIVTIWPGLAEGSNGSVDKVRMVRRKGIIPQPEMV